MQGVEKAINGARAYLAKNEPRPAMDLLAGILKADPKNGIALSLFGKALIQLGDPRAALQVLSMAIEILPDDVETINVYAVAAQGAGDLGAAETHLRKLLQTLPDNVGVLVNLATVLTAKSGYEEAESLYARALAIEPDHVMALYNQALLLLTLGRLEKGWPGFEARSRAELTGIANRALPGCQWQGEPLPDGTLLIHREQGLGDNLQFVRYAALAAERVKRVVVESPEVLADLLATVPGVDAVVTDASKADFDARCSVMSLPGIFQTGISNIPAAAPYVSPPKEMDLGWLEDLFRARPAKRHVGLAWAGNAAHRRDRERSISLDRFAPLFEVDDVSFWSLQIGPPARQIEEFDLSGKITALSGEPLPLGNVAGVLKSLDLLITVDTALAHLAGALNVPVWTLITHVPDWRWMLGRDDTPWYPSMRLFRQPAAGDWEGALKPCEQALRTFCDEAPG